MDRYRLTTIAAGAALLAALAFLAWPRSPGPLLGGLDSTRTGFVVDPDTPFTFGYLVLRNTASQPAILRSLALVDADPGLSVVGLRVLRTREASQGGVATSLDFPPALLANDPLRDFEGFAVLPYLPDSREDVWVLIGLIVPAAGIYNSEGVQVTYTVGSRDYTDRYPHGLRICSPIGQFDRCDVDDVPSLE